MSEVVFEKVEKRFGDQVAVRGIDLLVRPGEFVTLLGPVTTEGFATTQLFGCGLHRIDRCAR